MLFFYHFVCIITIRDKNAHRRVMNIFAHRGDGDKVEALLEDLYTLYLDHYEQDHESSTLMLPTTPFFSLALYAWSKSTDPSAPERAESLLEYMLEMEENREIPNLKVTSNFFNIVMVCWSKQRTPESVVKVQAIFDRLVEYSYKDNNKKPIGASYMALITTYARFDSAKAEDVFWQWRKEHDKGNCLMRIDGDLVRTLMESWHKSKEKGAAERCDLLLEFVIKSNGCHPSTSQFNMTIDKFCQTKTIAGFERAEEKLKQMQTYHNNNPRSTCIPNNLSYLPIIRSWALIGQIEKAEELLTDYFQTNRQFRPSIQQDIKNDYANSSRNITMYDTRIFNAVLKGWLSKASTVQDAAIRAENILLLTKRFNTKRNFASFQYVLDAWRRNKASFGSSWNQEQPRVEEIISLLDREYGHEDTNKDLYLTLRQGWRRLSLHRYLPV